MLFSTGILYTTVIAAIFLCAVLCFFNINYLCMSKIILNTHTHTHTHTTHSSLKNCKGSVYSHISKYFLGSLLSKPHPQPLSEGDGREAPFPFGTSPSRGRKEKKGLKVPPFGGDLGGLYFILYNY